MFLRTRSRGSAVVLARLNPPPQKSSKPLLLIGLRLHKGSQGFNTTTRPRTHHAAKDRKGLFSLSVSLLGVTSAAMRESHTRVST